MTIKLGIVRFGPGGRIFRAPFVDAAEGFTLSGVVTRLPRSKAEVEVEALAAGRHVVADMPDWSPVLGAVPFRRLSDTESTAI